MYGLRGAAAVSLVCFGCRFDLPPVIGDGPAGDASGDGAVDGPPDGEYVPACLTDPTYTTDPGTGHRYKLLVENLDYDSAIGRCAADDAHLAVVESSAENESLRLLHSGGIWIGFDDLTAEASFRWITGAPAGFLRWSAAEPNDNGGEDCTYLQSSGTWNDADCGESRRAVCECDPMYRPPPAPLCRTLPAGATTLSGRRYFVRAMARTWQQAKEDCESIGAHLLVSGDLDENTDLDAAIGGVAWLGYTDAMTEGTFTWVNGAPSAFNRWLGGNIPLNDGQDCAVLQDGGAWVDRACSEQYPYACECDPLPP